MVEFLNSDDLHFSREKVGPVEGQNNSAVIFSRYQLGVVTLRGCVDDLCYGLQAPYFGPSVLALEQAKAPIR